VATRTKDRQQKARQAARPARGEAKASDEGKTATTPETAAQRKAREAELSAWLGELAAKRAPTTPDLEAVASRHAQQPWGDHYRRFIAAEVATGRRSKDHPEAVAVSKIMGRGFEALQSEVLGIRECCGIADELQPELAELDAMLGLANEGPRRDQRAALEALRQALKAAVGKARFLDECNGATSSVLSRAVAAQLLDVEVRLSVFPAKEKKRPQLAATPEVAQKVYAHHVGATLARLRIPRRAAVKYLIRRGYVDAELLKPNDQRLNDQGKREKEVHDREPWTRPER